ncbi:uncharacterized protein AMSG_10386 [Thecamonas trahens ATCC 50062]|uniref:VPS9 domain-containing protein n=1 Tax=Thecamonas trahens ATCC 50062 TaxID=461836 RepID=A0A0L0DSV6_THETB|nr:hypothetical protein AMSG_10386 [Thecamonas trahens ATCC 50062]KNC54538.1 hypothetical protein AMSG_10386 [Thecamonas trahens ATCC 50062]|eukprot:XP_013753554.1 hypothetical protein AMSG_10386 [Thecamonas trahens ATCC 50062]
MSAEARSGESASSGSVPEYGILDPPPSPPSADVLRIVPGRGLVFSVSFVSSAGKKRLRPAQVVLSLEAVTIIPTDKKRGSSSPAPGVGESRHLWRDIARYGRRDEKSAIQLVEARPNGSRDSTILSFVLPSSAAVEWMYEAVAFFVTQAYVSHLNEAVGSGGSESGAANVGWAGDDTGAVAGLVDGAAPDLRQLVSGSRFSVRTKIINRFDEFQLKLHHWSMVQLLVSLHEALALEITSLRFCKLAGPALDAVATRLTDTLDAHREAIVGHPMFTWQQPRSEVREGLEMFAAVVLYGCVFRDHAALARDKALTKRISALQILPPTAFGVDAELAPALADTSALQANDHFVRARDKLHLVNAERCPRLKVVAILDACAAVYELIAQLSGASSIGADTLLPVLIYVILISRPPLLWTNLEYIQRFRAAEAMRGEEGYYTTQVWSAVTFLSSLDAADVVELHTQFLGLWRAHRSQA